MHRYLWIVLTLIIALAPVTQSEAASQKSKKKEAEKKSLISTFPPIVATYDVYVGGVHFLSADITFNENKDKYKTQVQAHTHGFWYRALPWDGTLQAEGRIKKDRFEPITYQNRDVWKNKPKETKLVFANGDVKPEFNPPNKDKNREQVTTEQRRGALDPITALLQMLAHVAINDSCDVTVPIFDGKRRFDLTGSNSGVDNIDEDDYNVYKGPARVCDADFKMIAGEWKDDRKKARFWQKNDKGDAGRDPFQIWLAKLEPTMPEMPVRLESSSVFGNIVIHLSSWKYAEQKEAAAIR